VAAIFVLAARSNWAQNQLNLGFHTFQDSRGVTVLSPDIGLDKDFTDRTGLRVKFGVDAISAASDSCARCHPEGANNSRVSLGVSMLRKYGDTKLTLGAEIGSERFYSATTLQSAISRDLNKGNTTIAGGFAYSFNRPQLHPTEDVMSQHSVDAYASLTQSWSKTTITQVGYELNQINGYQTNPFLRTSVNGVMTVGNSPELRTRQAITARLRQALGSETFVDLDYRRYHDTWAVNSNALSIGLSQHFGPRVVAGGSYRFYDQTAAYFYAPSYIGSPTYYTADFRLFPFDSGSYSGRIEITPRSSFFSLPVGSALSFQYERYDATTGFQAAIVSGGIRVPMK
jgi:hypothetical protein